MFRKLEVYFLVLVLSGLAGCSSRVERSLSQALQTSNEIPLSVERIQCQLGQGAGWNCRVAFQSFLNLPAQVVLLPTAKEQFPADFSFKHHAFSFMESTLYQATLTTDMPGESMALRDSEPALRSLLTAATTAAIAKNPEAYRTRWLAYTNQLSYWP